MFGLRKNHLEVTVGGGRWNAYGDPDRYSTHVLYELIKRHGVSDSVPDGRYRFITTRKFPFRIEMRLDPIDD